MSLNLKGDWNIMLGKLKKRYGELTDDDLAYGEGKQDEFIGNLQKKLNKTRAQIVEEIESL